MNRLTFISAAIGFSVFAGPGVGFAATEEFNVFGCDGAPRAARSVVQGSLSTVEIRVTDSQRGTNPTGMKYELQSMKADAEKKSANAFSSLIADGKGSFRDVAAGDWKICPATSADAASKLSVTQVAIINSADEQSDRTAWLGAGGVALTGLGFGILSGSDNSSSSTLPASNGSGDASPSAFDSEAAAQPLLPIENGGSGLSDGAGDKVACAAAEDCLKGERPPPLSPVL